jgi:hypothetical protein
MKYAVRTLVLLMVVGLAMAPAFAAELRVTGFIDNVFPRWEKNFSNADNDTTRNDNSFFGRARNRTFFNFIASDDLRGVLALEIDQGYGGQASGRVSGDCPEASAAFPFQNCGFDNGIDNLVLELKQLYVDFRVPQLPIGNRWRLGGVPFNVTPLHSPTLYTMDAGGGDVRFDFTEQVSVMLYYVQLEEDNDRFQGSTKIGEDYITGGTVMLKPLPGLDFHVLGVYNHGHAPFGPALTGTGGPFNGINADVTNVSTESRYYLGFDARYRIGNTSIEPGFLYLMGNRKFSSASAAATGVSDIDFEGIQAFLLGRHTLGPWLFAARAAYVSGDNANADINNRGIGTRSNVKGFRVLGVDTSHFFGEWLEVLGKSDVDGVGDRDLRRMGEIAKLDRFGWASLVGKAEYKATDSLIIEGAAGGVWTDKKPGCPAVVQTAAGACGGPLNSSGQPLFNFTGDSRFVGWEVDAGVRYTIMPGLTWTPRMGYADYGNATATNNRKATDAWVVINRLIYIY